MSIGGQVGRGRQIEITGGGKFCHAFQAGNLLFDVLACECQEFETASELRGEVFDVVAASQTHRFRTHAGQLFGVDVLDGG